MRRPWKFKQVIYAEILDEIHVHFNRLGVPYMPVKGAFLICSGLASKMRSRIMADIDILVMEKDFGAVCEYFSTIPHVRFLCKEWYFEKTFVYSIGDFECPLEIQWLLHYPARFTLSTDLLFVRGHRVAGFRFLPSPEDALVILLCHMLVHIAFEIRPTIFEEISLISSQPGFCWSTFWELMSQTGIMPFACFVLSWYKRETGVSLPSIPQRPLYSAALGRLMGARLGKRLPVFFRRIVLELPFVNDPRRLIGNKIRVLLKSSKRNEGMGQDGVAS
jgi:hypothetical protein